MTWDERESTETPGPFCWRASWVLYAEARTGEESGVNGIAIDGGRTNSLELDE